ncbi:MAG TPA: hypothetical protein VG273_22825, partial [Bryobacteraceae bacterium]|nr:hypothetical protein [Bryobacteraceae bacterium]
MSDEPLVLPEQTRLTKKPEFDSETNEPNDNWTKTSNRLYQYLYPNKVSGPLQMAIILHVAHQTWGQKPKQLWCKLSRPRGCKLFNCTNQGWDNAVRDLLARGLVERLKVNDGIENGSRFRL